MTKAKVSAKLITESLDWANGEAASWGGEEVEDVTLVVSTFSLQLQTKINQERRGGTDIDREGGGGKKRGRYDWSNNEAASWDRAEVEDVTLVSTFSGIELG